MYVIYPSFVLMTLFIFVKSTLDDQLGFINGSIAFLVFLYAFFTSVYFIMKQTMIFQTVLKVNDCVNVIQDSSNLLIDQGEILKKQVKFLNVLCTDEGILNIFNYLSKSFKNEYLSTLFGCFARIFELMILKETKSSNDPVPESQDETDFSDAGTQGFPFLDLDKIQYASSFTIKKPQPIDAISCFLEIYSKLSGKDIQESDNIDNLDIGDEIFGEN